MVSETLISCIITESTYSEFVVFVPICMHAASTFEGSDKDTSG